MWIYNEYGTLMLSEATDLPPVDLEPFAINVVGVAPDAVVTFSWGSEHTDEETGMPSAAGFFDVQVDLTASWTPPDWLSEYSRRLVGTNAELQRYVDSHEGEHDASRGAYLCETCWDAMTNEVLSGSQTDTGLDEARCVACQRRSTQGKYDTDNV